MWIRSHSKPAKWAWLAVAPFLCGIATAQPMPSEPVTSNGSKPSSTVAEPPTARAQKPSGVLSKSTKDSKKPKPVVIEDRTTTAPPVVTDPTINTNRVEIEDRTTTTPPTLPARFQNQPPVEIEDRTTTVTPVVPTAMQNNPNPVTIEDRTTSPGSNGNRTLQLPGVLERPIDVDPNATEPRFPKPEIAPTPVEMLLTQGTQVDPALGFAGPSGIIPRTGSNEDFMPMEDRWRIGFPFWDRYNKEFPFTIDYPYKLGHWWDPYNQNVLKGDYPILGQHTFFVLTVMSNTLTEGRAAPTPTTPFESTARPNQFEFFGRPNAAVLNQLTTVTFDIFHGDAAFKPNDWRVKITPAFNFNITDVEELGVLSNDVRKGSTRSRGFWALQEAFAEVKLADLSSEYDFVSMRVGTQPFVSDFRGFIFSDVNNAVRIFGNYEANRIQYNLAIFKQREKDTNSGLNTFNDRRQTVGIANLYVQDFVFPGYTFQTSVHYNNDRPSVRFDKNKFLVRPDPAGLVTPHGVEALYFGITGDGHIDRYNVTHAFYWVTGRDSSNPIAGQGQDINAFMGALELSYDRDWARFRASGFYSSGDGDVNNGHATGFDTILDNPIFAGENSFINRQQVGLFGVNLFQRNSLVPDLRSSKIQGQSNFVNPGLFLVNLGVDFDITPKLRMVNNVNYLWFDKTNVLETFVFQGSIDREIGVDISTSFEYRPLLNNNVIMLFGISSLLPSSGFKDLYNRLNGRANPLAAGFLEVVLMY